MNVREEERQKNSCPSRGLGLAAAAIGVGVGAALYYIFSKRPENPDGEGSTTGWNTEPPLAFNNMHEDSYTTISEHSTTDTSIHETEDEDSNTDSDSEPESEYSESDSYERLRDSVRRNYIVDTASSLELDISTDSEIGTEWDVTNSSLDLPEDSRSRSPMLAFFNRFHSPLPRRNVEQDRVTMLREQQFRERSWSLEECSICFDVILKDQQVTKLPCTHNFHSACITPWLQEQQTCPNCRKAAE